MYTVSAGYSLAYARPTVLGSHIAGQISFATGAPKNVHAMDTAHIPYMALTVFVKQQRQTPMLRRGARYKLMPYTSFQTLGCC